jgi:hypothetical protein
MKKRAAAAILWFYTGWFVGAFVAFAAGLPPVLGPILAIAAAAIFAGDPRRMIWTRPTVSTAIAPAPQSLHNAV